MTKSQTPHLPSRARPRCSHLYHQHWTKSTQRQLEALKPVMEETEVQNGPEERGKKSHLPCLPWKPALLAQANGHGNSFLLPMPGL